MRSLILVGVAGVLTCFPAALRAQSASDPRPHVEYFVPTEPGARSTAEFTVGEAFNIIGENFGRQQGNWVIEIFRATGGGHIDLYQLRVVEWTPNRVQVRIPENAKPQKYTLHFVVPGRLLQSNQVSLTVTPGSEDRNTGIVRVYPTLVYPRDVMYLYFSRPRDGYVAQIRPARGDRNVDMEVLERKPQYLKVRVPETLTPGSYKVSAFTAQGQEIGPRIEFAQLVTVSHPTAGYPHGTQYAFRIDAVQPVGPRSITAGEVVHILGQGLGVLGQGRDIRDKKRVEFVDVVGGHAEPHPMTVASGDWGLDRIVLRIPRDFKPGEYLVRVWDDRSHRSTNTLKVRVVGPIVRIGGQQSPGSASGAAMHLDRVEPGSVAAGGVLVLHGTHFGERQGDKIVALNRSGHTHRASIMDWSDHRIRVHVPAGLDPGAYRVVIYTDASMQNSSNSLMVTIKRPRASRAANLDLPVLLALGMDGLTAPPGLDSDLEVGGGELAIAQPKPIKERKPAERPLVEADFFEEIPT